MSTRMPDAHPAIAAGDSPSADGFARQGPVAMQELEPSAVTGAPELPTAGAALNWTGFLQAEAQNVQIASARAAAMRRMQRERDVGQLLLALERLERQQRLERLHGRSAAGANLRCMVDDAFACDGPAERPVLLLLAANRHRWEPGIVLVRRSGRWLVERVATPAG